MIHGLDADGFRGHTRKHLDKPGQRDALHRATNLISDRRAQAIAGVEDWERLREQARQIKAEVTGSLDVHLERFVENAERNHITCLLYTSPSPRDGLLSRMPSSA